MWCERGTTSGGQAKSTAYSITVPAPTAALTSLTPTSGQAAATVVITGTNLGTSGVVSFGGISAATSAWSATAITCTVPAGLSAGAKNVTVTPSGAAVSNALPFTVTVPAPPVVVTAALTSLTPTSGQAAATVVITGTNLGTSGVVSFGGISAATRAWSATAITCTVPAGLSAGVKNVTVTPSGAAVSNALPFTVTVPAPVPPSPSGNDTTAPTTTASFNDGDDRHDEAVTVHLSAIDNSGGVGVASITYSIDGGAPVTVIGSSVTVGMNSNDGDHEVDGDHATDRNQYRERDHSGERRDGTAGPHTITYYATDAAGNAEVAQTLTLDDDSSEGSAWLHLQHR